MGKIKITKHHLTFGFDNILSVISWRKPGACRHEAAEGCWHLEVPVASRTQAAIQKVLPLPVLHLAAAADVAPARVAGWAGMVVNLESVSLARDDQGVLRRQLGILAGPFDGSPVYLAVRTPAGAIFITKEA